MQYAFEQRWYRDNSPFAGIPARGFLMSANKQSHGGTQKLYACMKAFVYHYDEQRDRVKELHEVLIRA